MNKKTVYKNELLNLEYLKIDHESGLKIYLLNEPKFSASYAVFGTKYGSIDTKFTTKNGQSFDLPEGVAHFLEHKLFESEEVDAFEQYAKTGAYSNAYTSFDRTCYLFSCSDNFYENLNILLDFVLSPYFTEQTVAKEQGIIGQEINMYADSAPWRVLFNMLKGMYENHPVRIDIAGSCDSIAKINKDLLYSCYNTFYNPSNMFLCIAGSIDFDKVLDIVNLKIKPKDEILQSRDFAPEKKGVLKSFVSEKGKVAMPVFCFGFKEEKTDLTLKDKICSELLLEIIASDVTDLYERLTEQGLINDEFSTDFFNGRGYAVSLFEGESNDPQAVRDSILAEIEKLKQNGIDEELFNILKKSWYASFIRRFNSSEQIVTQMVDCAVNGDNVFDEINIIKNLTVSDVNKKLLNLKPENSVLSVILP